MRMAFQKFIGKFKRCKHPEEVVKFFDYSEWCSYCGSLRIDTTWIDGRCSNWKAPTDYLKKFKGAK